MQTRKNSTAVSGFLSSRSRSGEPHCALQESWAQGMALECFFTATAKFKWHFLATWGNWIRLKFQEAHCNGCKCCLYLISSADTPQRNIFGHNFLPWSPRSRGGSCGEDKSRGWEVSALLQSVPSCAKQQPQCNPNTSSIWERGTLFPGVCLGFVYALLWPSRCSNSTLLVPVECALGKSERFLLNEC